MGAEGGSTERPLWVHVPIGARSHGFLRGHTFRRTFLQEELMTGCRPSL